MLKATQAAKQKRLRPLGRRVSLEVTNEEFLAGGMLCGKSYEDLKENLEKFNYKKID